MKILILEPYAAAATALLHAQGFTLTHERRDLAEAEVLLIRSRTRVDAQLLDQAPKLKLVISATSGFDHLDWRECRKRGVIVAHTPEANAQSTAELTLGLMLSWARGIPHALKNVRKGEWREGLNRPHGLEGRSLGIIGLGRVGGRVARLAQAFGMRVEAYDPYIELENFQNLGVERVGFTELLRANDWVSLHVPLTRETKHLLNQPTFKEMQAEAMLVNTCRGPVVDENDLLVALDEGTIAGAAMDVIEREPPPPGHRLLQHPRLLLTPHIGAYTEKAWEKGSLEAAEKVLNFAKGQDVPDQLPLSTPWFEKT
jgi:D-3-phosphoglycerate dehydrogenase